MSRPSREGRTLVKLDEGMGSGRIAGAGGADVQSSPPDPVVPYIGQVLGGRFFVDGYLGQGAFAAVLHAVREDGVQAAVKVSLSEDPATATRFAREVKVMRALPHSPHLVKYLGHGRTGDGNGMVVQRGFKHPQSLHEERLRQGPLGYFFHVVTNGFGQMSSYAAQISPADRWAIAAYVRALQLSQHAPVSQLTPEDLEHVANPTDPAAEEPAEAH